jgi:gamma-aminobutyric acid type B receptor
MACMASPWLYSLGFVITFSALFAKTYRIAKIFNNKSMQRIKIKTKDLFGAVGILAVLDGTLLAAWQVSSPLQWQRGRTQIDSFNRTLETLGVCTDVPLGMTSAPSSTDSNTFLAVIACLHVGLLMYGNYLTYTARNLPTTFQESKWIALAMGSMLQLFMMGVPIVYAVANDPTARGLVMTSVIFLNNLVLIGAVMFPKLHAYYALGDGKGMKGVTSVKGTTRACSSVAPTSVAHSSAAATVVTSSHAAA